MEGGLLVLDRAVWGQLVVGLEYRMLHTRLLPQCRSLFKMSGYSWGGELIQ